MTRYKNPLSPNISLWGALALLWLAYSSESVADGDAQWLQSLTPGMRVRILAPEVSPSKIIDTIDQVSDDSVTLDIPGRDAPVSILREKIARLDISGGPRSRASMRRLVPASAPAPALQGVRWPIAADAVTSS